MCVLVCIYTFETVYKGKGGVGIYGYFYCIHGSSKTLVFGSSMSYCYSYGVDVYIMKPFIINFNYNFLS